MVGYIQQLARRLAERLDTPTDASVAEIFDHVEALREEVDRLDPRDFVADARVRFIDLRVSLRRLTKFSQDNWNSLINELNQCRNKQNHCIRLAVQAEEGYPPNLELAAERRKAAQEAAGAEEGTREDFRRKRQLFQDIEDVLQSYGGPGSQAVARSFAFVKDAKLREIIERDFDDLKRKLYPDGAWKSAVIMAGSILEAILYDLLTRDAQRIQQAMASSEAPKKDHGKVTRDLTSDKREDGWMLNDLIKVSVDLGLLRKENAATIDQSLRDYRNYVHPRKEVKEAHPCGEPQAMLALGALLGVCEHLS